MGAAYTTIAWANIYSASAALNDGSFSPESSTVDRGNNSNALLSLKCAFSASPSAGTVNCYSRAVSCLGTGGDSAPVPTANYKSMYVGTGGDSAPVPTANYKSMYVGSFLCDQATAGTQVLPLLAPLWFSAQSFVLENDGNQTMLGTYKLDIQLQTLEQK